MFLYEILFELNNFLNNVLCTCSCYTRFVVSLFIYIFSSYFTWVFIQIIICFPMEPKTEMYRIVSTAHIFRESQKQCKVANSDLNQCLRTDLIQNCKIGQLIEVVENVAKWSCCVSVWNRSPTNSQIWAKSDKRIFRYYSWFFFLFLYFSPRLSEPFFVTRLPKGVVTNHSLDFCCKAFDSYDFSTRG